MNAQSNLFRSAFLPDRLNQSGRSLTSGLSGAFRCTCPHVWIAGETGLIFQLGEDIFDLEGNWLCTDSQLWVLEDFLKKIVPEGFLEGL